MKPLYQQISLSTYFQNTLQLFFPSFGKFGVKIAANEILHLAGCIHEPFLDAKHMH
jgi:hypothetical protein